MTDFKFTKKDLDEDGTYYHVSLRAGGYIGTARRKKNTCYWEAMSYTAHRLGGPFATRQIAAEWLRKVASDV